LNHKIEPKLGSTDTRERRYLSYIADADTKWCRREVSHCIRTDECLVGLSMMFEVGEETTTY
jgi:hypothetical protein